MDEILKEIISKNRVKGCSIEEIEEIQSLSKGPLPAAYLKFLEDMGQYASFLRGESCFYKDLPYLKKSAQKAFIENLFTTKLLETDFVFSSLQATAYWYFNIRDGDDPPVYYFQEGTGQKEPFIIAPSFSNYLYRKFNKDPSLFQEHKEK